MKSLKLLFYIILITWKIVDCEERDSRDAVSAVSFNHDTEDTEFVDPYSFDYDRANKKMLVGHTVVPQSARFSGSEGICVSDDQCRRELKQCKDALDNIEFDRLYTMRLINLLLSSAKLEEEDEFLTGSVTLSGQKAQIEKLRQFSHGKITIRQVDGILSEIIKPRIKTFEETLDFMNRLYIATHEYKGTIMALSAALVVLLLYRYVNWSTGNIIFAFLIFGLILSYFMMWEQLKRESELKQLVKMSQNKERPIQCDPEKMSSWETVKTLFHWEDKCHEYYRATHLSASYEVNPIDVLLELFDRVIIRLGSAIGGFIKNATQHLGLPMWSVITVLLYILLPVLIFCYFVPFRIWFGPFFGVAIGGGQKNEIQRESPMIEQRKPVTEIHIAYDNISPTVSVRNSEAELRILGPNPVAQPIQCNTLAIGGGDSETQRPETRQGNSGATCSSCCCKNSLNNPHIQENEDFKNNKTKSEVRNDEKGDGDC